MTEHNYHIQHTSYLARGRLSTMYEVGQKMLCCCYKIFTLFITFNSYFLFSSLEYISCSMYFYQFRNCIAVKERTLNCILPLSTLASRTICDTLFRQVWKHLISLQSRSEMFNSKLAFDREDKQIERILQEWIDSSLNITLRAKLLKKIFYHEFQFCLDVESNPLIENDTGDIDSYFRVWRQLFKILYHFSMKDFIIPDVKAIHVDRMYLNMEKHLMYHKGNIYI